MEKSVQHKTRVSAAALAFFCVFFALLLTLLVAVNLAHASDLSCEGISYAYDDDGVRCEPSNAWNIAIGFSANVAVADGGDDSFIQRNLDRVHLLKADGSEAPNWHASVQGGGRRVIYIELEDWLEPLTEYQVVVDAGLETADGSSVLTSEYRESFKTGSATKNGLSVYQNVAIVAVPLLLVAGAIIQVIRTRRQRP